MSSFSYCPKEKKPCMRWVEKYFKDCLCNVKDELSFACGIISLVCWGVAEIPQIVSNFNTKSSHGVSLAFLLTWVAGDVFNLVGCVLEPATLPTQYYTALLYTISTIVLVIQSIYYDHFYKRSNRGRSISVNEEDEEEKKPLEHSPTNDSGIPIPKASPKPTLFYFTSARSLASSGTPTYMRAAKSGPSAMSLHCDSSSDDESTAISSNAPTQPRPIPRSVGYGTFLATSLNLPPHCKALSEIYVGFTGRKLLQHGGTNNMYGQWLGWLMAAIYMGGRLPQIWLNIKRGSVEGLNPLMFVFALVANVTYVGSILMRSTEWEKIRANMPWLLDAAVCVALDLFIILQYIYYRYSHNRGTRKDGEYMEATKNSLS